MILLPYFCRNSSKLQPRAGHSLMASVTMAGVPCPVRCSRANAGDETPVNSGTVFMLRRASSTVSFRPSYHDAPPLRESPVAPRDDDLRSPAQHAPRWLTSPAQDLAIGR